MTKIPFYDLTKAENAILKKELDYDIALQLPNGNYLRTTSSYGLDSRVEVIDRVTKVSKVVYTHPVSKRLDPIEVLDDGNVILLAFDYPYHNYKLFRSTNPSLTNFEEVLHLGYMKPYSKHGIAKGKNGTILCGEYIGSYAWDEPDVNTECKVWKSDDNGLTWDVLYAFRRNNHPDQFGDVLMGNGIQHIHVVEYDEYTDSFWIGTGDSDRESSIWTWNDRDGFELRGRGYFDGYEGDEGQLWRAIAFEFYPDCVMWGTDGVYKGTWVMRYDRDSKTLSYTTDKRTDGYMFYSDTIELLGGQKVSFFSGTSGTIYYTYDQQTVHILKEFDETYRTIYVLDKIGNKMLFCGGGKLTLNGETINTASIEFRPRNIPLNFLGS